MSWWRGAPALEANFALADLITKVAERKNATGGQVAPAWLIAQKPWIVPIRGTRRQERLDENRASAHLHLTSADPAELGQSITALQKYPADFAVQVSIERSANRR
jgi:aryl-alcohol dehydrogenase-like predicted oxidoreductase